MNGDGSSFERLVTVPEAAEILGISPEAVRARLNRGTLPKEKGDDGTTYVRLNDDRTHSNSNSTNDRTNDRTGQDSLAFRLMQDQNEYLRRQLEIWQEEARRKDHIIAALTERIPELEPAREAPSEPRDADLSAPEERGSGDVPPEQEKPVSWWRKLFSG
jgi:hypothetical protein